jgi:hypothetical protein
VLHISCHGQCNGLLFEQTSFEKAEPYFFAADEVRSRWQGRSGGIKVRARATTLSPLPPATTSHAATCASCVARLTPERGTCGACLCFVVPQIRLVVFAACESLACGNAAVVAGVPHVVATVRQVGGCVEDWDQGGGGAQAWKWRRDGSCTNGGGV